MSRKWFWLILPLLIFHSLWAQSPPIPKARIIVADTVPVIDNENGIDSVRYLLCASERADSLHWYPDSLFLNPEADSQWVTLCCRDTLKVYFRAKYNSANLLRWSEPDYMRSHTEYIYLDSPGSGSLCRPGRLAVDTIVSPYCASMVDAVLYKRSILLSPDTTVQADLYNGAHEENAYSFYVDTVCTVSGYGSDYNVWVEFRRLNRQNNANYYLPLIGFTVQRVGASLSGGIGIYSDLNWNTDAHVGFWNLGGAFGDTLVIRFFAIPTSTYTSVRGVAIDRLELVGPAEVSDSVLLMAPDCRCTPVDIVDAYICESQLPYSWDSLYFEAEGIDSVQHYGLRCDTLYIHHLHITPNSESTVYDTALERQMPWHFLDTLFTDSVSNFSVILPNEAGCDSIIHYNLHVFWDGDHCDSMLRFPNAVTANGDGINDRFVVSGLIENACYPYNLLIIYDRTGREVYRAENITRDDQFWDPAAARMPSGTYIYFFQGHGVEIQTRHVGVIEVLR